MWSAGLFPDEPRVKLILRPLVSPFLFTPPLRRITTHSSNPVYPTTNSSLITTLFILRYLLLSTHYRSLPILVIWCRGTRR